MKAAIVHNLANAATTEEILDLAEAAGYQVAAEYTIDTNYPHSDHYLTEYELNELEELIEGEEMRKIIFDSQLRPGQTFSIEERLEIEVIDKPMLILEIFESKANSRDIKMQIKLAQLKYAVPRMVKEIGEAVRTEKPGYGGSGEQATDILISDMQRRIRTLEQKIEEYKKQYVQYEQDIHPKLPIVGYYSSGKSTIFNILCESERDVGEEAFTTMVLKTGRSQIAGYTIDIIDTVGLVDLPNDIMTAFDLMLRSIFAFSGMILCVDASLSIEQAKAQLTDFKTYVERFGDDQPLRVLIFLTKADKIDYEHIHELKKQIHYEAWLDEYEIVVSDYTKPNEVRSNFVAAFERLFEDKLVDFYYQRLDPSTASRIHDIARVDNQEWHNDGTTSLSGVIPKAVLAPIREEIIQ